MKYIILPEFYFQDKLNQKISYLIEQHPEYFLFPIKIESEEGSYPFTFWNGTGNNNLYPLNLPAFANYQLVCDTLKKNNKIGLDLTNQYLSEKDIKNNTELNTILKILENGSNYLILNNYTLGEILKEKYPLYYQVYDTIFDNNSFRNLCHRIKIPYTLLENYTSLKKNKIEVVFPIKCQKCSNFKKEQLSQFLFSEKSLCINCNRKIKTNFSNEIQELNKKGYQFFSFNTQGIFKNDYKIFTKLFCDTFIKENFYFQVLYFLENE